MRTAKAWVAAVGLVVVALTGALADDVFNVSDTTAVVTTLIEACVAVWAVYQVPNKPDTNA